MFRMSSVKCLASGFSRPHRPSEDSGARGGFTLLELMVTLGVLTVLVVLAAPAIRVDGAEADAAAHRVRSALQHAQRTALVQQHSVIVSFDLTKNRVRIVEDKNSNHAINNGERITYRPLELGNSFAPPPKRLTGATTTAAIIGNNVQSTPYGGLPTVIFRRDGSLSSDLELYLKTVRNGKESHRAISVRMATGRADWFKYVGGTTNWRQGGI